MIDVTGMLTAYERDKLSASAQSSRNAVGRTWREYHTKAFALRLQSVAGTIPADCACQKGERLPS